MGIKAAILGVGGAVPCSLRNSNSTAMNACGLNTGNLLFQYSIQKLLLSHGVQLIYPDLMDDDVSPAAIDQCNLTVVPCADFLNPEYSLDGLWNRLRYVEKPCLPIGLGIGSDNPNTEMLPESTVSVLNYFRSHSRFICIRGSSTREALLGLGFNSNQLVTTGCISNLLGSEVCMRNSFSMKIPILQVGNDPLTIISGDRPWKAENSAIERALYQIFRKNINASYLIQSHYPLVELTRPELGSSSFYELAGYAADLLDAINPHGTLKDLVMDIETRFKIWFDIDDWISWATEHILSLGLRLHGNMVSLQAGVPSLWIGHDPRTKELIESMQLPSLAPDDLAYSNTFYRDTAEIFQMQIDKYFEKRRSIQVLLDRTLSQVYSDAENA